MLLCYIVDIVTDAVSLCGVAFGAEKSPSSLFYYLHLTVLHWLHNGSMFSEFAECFLVYLAL